MTPARLYVLCLYILRMACSRTAFALISSTVTISPRIRLTVSSKSSVSWNSFLLHRLSTRWASTEHFFTLLTRDRGSRIASSKVSGTSWDGLFCFCKTQTMVAEGGQSFKSHLNCVLSYLAVVYHLHCNANSLVDVFSTPYEKFLNNLLFQGK